MDESSGPARSRSPVPRCELCGEPVGVYEPLVVATADGWRMTSIAAEPELDDPRLNCRHAGCAPGR